MKNGRFHPLLMITAVFCAFLLGLLSGRLLPMRSRSLPNTAVQTSASFVLETATEKAETIGVININTASAEDLSLLPGIGPTLAERIVAYRQTAGNFQSIEDLLNVKGIGNTIFSGISKYITTGG